MISLPRIPILFDLDGTLLDLPVEIETARRRIAELFARSGYHGSLSPILARIEEAARFATPNLCEAEALKAQALAILDEAELEAAPRARARAGATWAAAQAEAAMPVGVVTDQGRACVVPALAAAGLEALASGARAIVTRDDVACPKPAPDGVLAAARALLGGGSGPLVVVGDSERDARAASAAGARAELAVRFFGVAGGQSSAQALRAAGADEVLAALDELPEALRRFGPRCAPSQ